ncbi:hypothetical protein DFS33DRAFT_1276914 [Desarmillaria ectypa]|nr:hypothetical protein DFS33DRAFT_1276914 [Desarmillaria ectypa]
MVDAILSLLLDLSRTSQWWSLMIETPGMPHGDCKPVGGDPVLAMICIMQGIPSERVAPLLEAVVSRIQTLTPMSYALGQSLDIMYYVTTPSILRKYEGTREEPLRLLRVSPQMPSRLYQWRKALAAVFWMPPQLLLHSRMPKGNVARTKLIAKKLRNMRTNGNMMPITNRDEHFLQAMKLSDIHGHARSIKAQAQHVRRDYPLVIALDYVSVPMTVTVRSSLDFKDLEVSASSWDELIEEARSQRGELVYVRLPELSQTRESFQCVAMEMRVLRA